MHERLFRLWGALVLAASLAVGWLGFGYQAFVSSPLTVPPAGLIIDVAPGTSLNLLAQQLHRRHIVASVRYFVWMGRIKGASHAIQTGEYRIEPGMTPEQLLVRIVQGKVVEYSLTLVEGWTFRQVIATIRANPYLRHTLDGVSDAAIMAKIGAPGVFPEGRFFPDTYNFPRGLTDVEFLRRAYQRMNTVLAAEWAQRAPGLPLQTPDQALTLASIIEKETGRPGERAEVAGVFIRRLQKGMRLQTDPSVIYGLGLAFDGNLRKRDLERDTPYNTYTRKGLPPTPIAMPGRASIHAALHPAVGDALYFVARGDGSHQFSATLEQQDQAIRRYQLHR